MSGTLRLTWQNMRSFFQKLANIESFKEEIWKSYFKARIELYKDLVEKYQAAEKRKKEIEEEAGKQRTQWESVIEIFNSRFFVPFKLTAKNRVSVILGQEPMLSLGFTFEDGARPGAGREGRIDAGPKHGREEGPLRPEHYF